MSSVSDGPERPRSAQRITRRRGSCGACRSRKVRCDGAKPCYHCGKLGQECIYPELMQRRRRASGHRAANSWPPLTPQLSTVSTWSADDNFSWSNLSDPSPGFDLPSIQESTDLASMPLREEVELFSEFSISSPSVSGFLHSLGGVVPRKLQDHQQGTDAPVGGCNQNQPSEPGTHDASPTAVLDESLLDWDSTPPPEKHQINIDFSAATLYGLPDFIGQNVPASTTAKVVKFMETLGEALRPSNGPSISKQSTQLACWNINDDVMIRRWCNACSDVYPVNSFLEKDYLVRVVEQARKPNPDTLVSVFARAVLAYGCHAASVNDSPGVRMATTHGAYQRLQVTLEDYRSLQGLPDGLLKLQTCLLLAIISKLCDTSITGELIAAAVQCARNMRLFRPRQTQGLLTDSENEMAERGISLLYCMEADHAIYQGMPPLLDYDWISRSYTPGNSAGDDLAAECNLFSLMHAILRQQYSPDAMQPDSLDCPPDRLQQLQWNEQRLKRWLARHPVFDSLEGDEICNPSKFADTLRSSDVRQQQRLLYVLCLYHKAVFFIFCPWMSTSRVEPPLASAFTLIQVASQLLFSDVVAPRTSQELYRLLPVSLGVILFHVANGGKSERLKAMPYFGFFGAILGRVALGCKVGVVLDAYFELVASDGFG